MAYVPRPGELFDADYDESTLTNQLIEWDLVFTAGGLTPGQLLTKMRSWDMTIAKLPTGAAKTTLLASAATLRDKGQDAYDIEQGIAPPPP